MLMPIYYASAASMAAEQQQYLGMWRTVQSNCSMSSAASQLHLSVSHEHHFAACNASALRRVRCDTSCRTLHSRCDGCQDAFCLQEGCPWPSTMHACTRLMPAEVAVRQSDAGRRIEELGRDESHPVCRRPPYGLPAAFCGFVAVLRNRPVASQRENALREVFGAMVTMLGSARAVLQQERVQGLARIFPGRPPPRALSLVDTTAAEERGMSWCPHISK